MNELKKIKTISLILFIISIFGILGTLVISNILVTYKISFHNYPFKYTNIEPILCSKENNFCKDFEVYLKSRSENLDECRRASFRIDIHNIVKCKNCEENIIPAEEYFNSFFYKNKFIGSLDEVNYFRHNKLGGEKNWKIFTNKTCILNSNLYKYYQYFPYIFNKFTEIIDSFKTNQNYSAGHSVGIMPYFFGETSISNIAKRFPINYFFKTLMILSSFLIFVYWRAYNNLFKKITNQKTKKIFFITGVLSSFFLLLHVIFLGSNIDISYFDKLKRLILILFIFFEIFAQANLVINLYAFHEKIKFNINSFYLELKKYLIIFILIVFVIGIGIYISIDLGSKFNNIIEWNFFTLLIFFLFVFLFYVEKRKS